MRGCSVFYRRMKEAAYTKRVGHYRDEAQTFPHPLSDRHPSLSSRATRCVRGRTMRHRCSPGLQQTPIGHHQASLLFQFASTTKQPHRGRSTATIPAEVHVNIVSPPLGDVRHIAVPSPTRRVETLVCRLFQGGVQGPSGDTAVTREQIDTMLIHNPGTIFERHGG